MPSNQIKLLKIESIGYQISLYGLALSLFGEPPDLTLAQSLTVDLGGFFPLGIDTISACIKKRIWSCKSTLQLFKTINFLVGIFIVMEALWGMKSHCYITDVRGFDRFVIYIFQFTSLQFTPLSSLQKGYEKETEPLQANRIHQKNKTANAQGLGIRCFLF